VKVSPDFTLTGTNPSGCNLSDGTVNLSINTTAPVGGPYSYFISGPLFNNQGFDNNAPFSTGNLLGVSAGTISGIVTDQISGCTISKAASLSDATFSASADAITCPSSISVTVVGATSGTVLYTFTNIATRVRETTRFKYEIIMVQDVHSLSIQLYLLSHFQ
jgi:hypothetical protein